MMKGENMYQLTKKGEKMSLNSLRNAVKDIRRFQNIIEH